MDCHAQLFKKKKKEQVTVEQVRPKISPKQEGVMEFIVEGNDTIYIDQIRASKVYSRLPKMKGREWRQYYRLVHNFSKAYPYALVAKKLVMEEAGIEAAPPETEEEAEETAKEKASETVDKAAEDAKNALKDKLGL